MDISKSPNPQISKSPRSGFTLIEMLVVIGIMLLMVGAAATLMQPASESRRAREAGRSLNVYCSNARNRALTNGRPCGVTFHCFSTTGPAFAMTVDQCETPPFYAGDTDTSAVQIQQTAAGSNSFRVKFIGGVPPKDMVHIGDTIQINQQGFSYDIIIIPGGDTWTVSLPSTPGAITPWPIGPTNWSIAMPYRINRAPMKGIAAPLQLPARVVVDLQWSGTGSGYLGTPYAAGTYATGDTVKYTDGIVYVSKHGGNNAIPTSTTDWEPLTEVTVLFSPTGSADKIYCNGYGQQINEKIYLLLGRRDRVSNAFTAGNSNETTLANVQDAENALWLTVNPQSGVIATEKVAVNATTVSLSRRETPNRDKEWEEDNMNKERGERNEGRGMRGEERGECRVSAIHHSSFITHHSGHSARRGFTILEVLVSMAVLIFGLLGVAALIPLAKYSMTETNKSDRTGACGRAGLHDVKVRRLLACIGTRSNNTPYSLGVVIYVGGSLYECTTAGTSGGMPPTNWTTNPVNDGSVKWTSIGSPPILVVDPRGVTAPTAATTNPLGGTLSLVPRINLPITSTDALANSIFLWHDDLNYASAKESRSPTNGDRPMAVGGGGAGQQVEGNYSWFFSLTPLTNEAWPSRRRFDVSIVVCHKRQFGAATSDPNAGETIVENVVCDNAQGFGGIGIEYTGSQVLPKANEWVLLCSENPGTMTVPRSLISATWYRVVAAGNDGTTTRATLVGPDWNGGLGGTGSPVTPNNSVKLIVVKGVSGVYTTNIKLDDDYIWSK